MLWAMVRGSLPPGRRTPTTQGAEPGRREFCDNGKFQRVNSSELMVSGTSSGSNVKFTMGKYTISDGRYELLSNHTLVGRASAKLIRQEMVKISSVRGAAV